MDSLTGAALTEITKKIKQYQVDGKAAGISIFYTIAINNHIETRATVTDIQLWLKLAPLQAKFKVSANWNVKSFNTLVQTQLMELDRRGSSQPNLITTMLLTYQTCPDEEFGRWAERVLDDHEDGSKVIRDEEFEAKVLIPANTKY